MIRRASTLLSRTVKSAVQPKMLPLVAGSALASAAAVAGLAALSAWVTGYLTADVVEWDWVTTLLQGIIGVAIAWFGFPLIMPLIISAFVNRIAAIIEKNEFDDRSQGRDMPFWPELWMDMKFSVYAVLINLLILPVYLIPGLNFVVYYLVNGHLLGKQYFLMVARRHHNAPALRLIIRNHGGTMYFYGFWIVLLGSIPLANLLAPLLATALMVHVFQAITVKEQLTA